MERVKVWQEKVEIPTYAVGKPDKNPMFLERRVYQGSSGKVYPHTVIDSVSDTRETRAYQAVYLENEYLLIMVLPELGGRIQRALDKTNGYDFVYYNRVIKPAMVGLAGPWISGGIEFNWPQHHRPSTFDPVRWTTETHEDGSASIIVGEIETMFRTKGMSRFTLSPGKAFLRIDNQLFNRTAQPQTFLWWANPAVPVNDRTRSIFPPDVYAVMDHGKRDVSAFPIARGTYYKMDYSAGVDISRYKNIPVPTSYMAYHSDYDFVGNYDDGREAGLLHVADHHISPGKKQWTWGNGEFGQAWDRNLTDEDGPYIELMTGCFTDNQPDFSFLMPEEEKRFTQYFMPYKKVGAVKNATREAMIGLEREGENAVVRVYATAVYPGARIIVRREGETLLNASADLDPEHPFETSLPRTDEPLTVTVENDRGHCLVAYVERERNETPLPNPAEAIPPANEVESTELLLLYGRHLEQYRHATWDAADYYLEGLRREPEDTRLNNAYGKLLLQRGLVEEARDCFQNAQKAATIKNPNPYDGEYAYNLGVAQALLGEWDAAYDAFFKATWNGAWQNAAFYRIGCIDLMREDVLSALEHLRLAVDRNSRDTLARNALAVALLKAGDPDKAADLARETLSFDPLDGVAEHLMCRCEGKAWNPDANANTLIEWALEYARCGESAAAIEILRAAADREEAVSPLIYYHLAAISGDDTWLESAEHACPDGCFPHRLEDEIALRRAADRLCRAPRAHAYLGCYWYDKRQYARAIAHWEQAVSEDAAYPTAHRNLALAYYNKLNLPALALREMETAFACDPSDARVLLELDQLRKKLNAPAADRLSKLEASRALVDQRDDLTLEYVTLLNTLGRYTEALSILETRKFHPWEGGEGKVPAQWRISLTMLSREAMACGDYAGAIPLLEKAAGPYPHNLGEGRLIGTRQNDAWYLLGSCLEALRQTDAAREAYHRAAAGQIEPAGMQYYNDQPPEMIFYQGLAMKALREDESARRCFQKLRDYAAAHLEDEIRIEYFAVSLPDLQIFDEDLNARNRAHCLLMDALGAIGLGDAAAARASLDRLYKLYPEHQGARVHAEPSLEQVQV